MMKFDALGHINAAGCTPSSLYTAVANQMLFAKPSKALIRCDISLDAPYVFVEIEELAQLDRQTRCLLLLSQLFENLDINTLRQKYRINKIVCVLPANEANSPLLDNDTLTQLISETIPTQTPEFSQVSELDINTLTNDTLVVAVDSCNSYQYVSEQAKTSCVQVFNGPPGIINGEGGWAFLVHNNGLLNADVYTDTDTLAQQITQANAKSHDCYLFSGKQSLAWQTRWFANTQDLYQQNDQLIEFADLSAALGYQGVATTAAGLILANSYLTNPLHQATLSHVYLVLNASNEQLIKISRSENA